MVLLWVVRQAAKAELSGLGVSVEGSQSLSVRCGVACLLDKWGSTA